MIVKNVFIFVLYTLSIFVGIVPEIWSEMNWSLGTLHEQLAVPPDHITPRVYFGASVALSDQFAIIGAKKDNQIVKNGGSAYIYEKNDVNEWILVKKIVGSNNNKNDYLGISVGLAGNFAFAGANSYSMNENSSLGIVYVYQRQNDGEWMQTQTLIPEAIDSTHNFGCSIAAYNTQLIVGAYGNTKESGKAFFFELEGNQWILRQCLEPKTPDIKGRFGNAVDIYDDYIIVGAYVGFDGKGVVYIFQKMEGIWKQIELFESPSPDYNTLFGYDVAINDQYAIVGSKGEYKDDMRNVGAVYVYQNKENSWEFMSKLSEPDLNIDDKFGVSIDINGDILAVSGTKMDSDIEDSGAVNIYRIKKNQFTLLKRITAQSAQTVMLYGSALKMYKNMVLIGAEGYKNNDYPIGGAYFYTLDSSEPFGSDGVLGLDDIVRFLQIMTSQ